MDKLRMGVSHNPTAAYRLKYRNKTPLAISWLKRFNTIISLFKRQPRAANGDIR